VSPRRVACPSLVAAGWVGGVVLVNAAGGAADETAISCDDGLFGGEAKEMRQFFDQRQFGRGLLLFVCCLLLAAASAGTSPATQNEKIT